MQAKRGINCKKDRFIYLIQLNAIHMLQKNSIGSETFCHFTCVCAFFVVPLRLKIIEYDYT